MARHVIAFERGFIRAAAAIAAGQLGLPKPALEAVLEQTLREEGASGVALFDAMDLLGFLIGTPLHGREMRSPLGAHGARHPLDYGELYGAASALWVGRGLLTHSVVVAADQTATLDAWFDLSFGKQQVHALRDTSPLAGPAGIDVRRATLADLDDVLSMGGLVAEHQEGPPTFAPAPPGFFEQLPASLRGDLESEAVRFFIASIGGMVSGFSLWRPAGPGLFIPPKSCELNVAATRTAARGRGIGSALTAHGLGWARDHGYEWCVTDWRSTNLLSSRFWTTRGFEPRAFRLARLIPPDVLSLSDRRRQ